MSKKISIGKIILSVVLGFVIIIGTAVFILFSTVTSMNKVHPPKEVVLGNGAKQAALIYEPSKSNLNDEVALKVADLVQNKGYKVTVNYPSKDLNYNLNDYDVIIFASPVYAGKVSPVLKEYVENNPVENKKIIAYTVGKFDDNKKELES